MSEQVSSALKRQALQQHLKDMRTLVIVSVAAILVAFVALFYFAVGPLVDFVLAPVRAKEITVITTGVSEALVMQFKTCLVAAVVCAMPVLMWQIWRFISPALYPSEKKIYILFFLIALLLFAVGVAFSYLAVFPLAINLFFEAGVGIAAPMWSVSQYFNFTLSFVLPFGLMFELPVVVTMMAMRGWVDYKKMSKARKYMVLAIVTVAAVLTPPDIVSQMMLAAPMFVLYEIATQLTRVVKPRKRKEE